LFTLVLSTHSLGYCAITNTLPSLSFRCARLTQAGKAQTAVLRNAYAAKMKDKDELVVDMLRTLKENKVMEPLQVSVKKRHEVLCVRGAVCGRCCGCEY